MAQPSTQGRFVLESLLSEDPAASTAFYGKLIGWRAAPFEHDATYTVFSTASGPAAITTQLTDAIRAHGGTPRWTVFIGSDDVDATVAHAERLGAKVRRAAWDTAGGGRSAVLNDPQGAVFGVTKLGQPPAASKGPPQPGEFAWRELATSDPDAALKFYQELFGWQVITRMEMGPAGTYTVIGSEGVQRGGIFKLSQPGAVPHWLPYVEVADADKAAAAATRAGARVLNGPMDVPGGGRIAQLADPHGIAFAVHSMAKPAAAPAPKPAPKPAAAPSPAPAPKPAPAPAAKPPAPPAPKPAAPAAPKPPAPAPAKAAPAKAAPAKKKPAAKKKAAPKKKKAAPKKKAVAKRKKAAKRKTAAKKKSKSARKSARPATKRAKRGKRMARRKK
jgi:uncharacterized protein